MGQKNDNYFLQASTSCIAILKNLRKKLCELHYIIIFLSHNKVESQYKINSDIGDNVKLGIKP